VLKNLENIGVCRLVGIADVNRSKLEWAGSLVPRATLSTDYRELIRNDELEAVDIVTPTSTHYSICSECLEAGKHVFIEKPLTTSYQQALRLVSLAKKQGRVLMVGHIFRYNEAVRHIKHLLKEDTIGKLRFLRGRFVGLKDPREDVGVVFNFAVHYIDIYDFLLESKPIKVLCHVDYFLGREEYEDYAVLVLEYPSKVTGVIEASWLMPGKIRDLLVVGDRCSVLSDLLAQKIALHKARIERCEVKLIAKDEGVKEYQIRYEEPLKLELQDFFNCIRNDTKPLSSGEVAARVIKIAEDALRAAHNKKLEDTE
jgi:predicted dehydrogenase